MDFKVWRSEADLRDYYYQAIATGASSDEGLFCPPPKILLKLSEQIPSEPHRRALDIGYGDGQCALSLAARDFLVDAVDIIPAGVFKRKAKALGLASLIKIWECNVADFEVAHNYSAVVAKDVLHFCPDFVVFQLLQHLVLSSATPAFHYIEMVTDIERSDKYGRSVEVVGEANFTQEEWSELVSRVYDSNWSIRSVWTDHVQRNWKTGSIYFRARRCILIATKSWRQV